MWATISAVSRRRRGVRSRSRPVAHAGGPSLVLGATEDAVRSTTLATGEGADGPARRSPASARCGSRRPGRPGERELSAQDKTVLQNVAAAAKLANVTVLTSVMNQGSKTTPLTAGGSGRLCRVRRRLVAETVPALRILIVGNEPNLNRYWLPQFNDDGSDAAAPAYEALLAQTYDAVKAAAPGRRRCSAARSRRAAATSPAGSVRRIHRRSSSSDMGQAYRDSGRTTPIMDGFAFHPYEDNSSVAPVSGTHPNTTDDRARRLRQARRVARRGVPATTRAADLVRRVRRRVADPGGEAERSTPAPSRRRRSRSPRRRRPRTTGRRCSSPSASRTSDGLFLFHSVDETRPRRLAVGRLLRRRHAEVEPRRRRARARAVAPRRRRALRRARARRAAEGRSGAGPSSRSPATSTARTSRSSTGSRASSSSRSTAAPSAAGRPRCRCACRRRSRRTGSGSLQSRR